MCVGFFSTALIPNIFSPNKHLARYDRDARKTYVELHAKWSLQLASINKNSNDKAGFAKIT
jgi:hypothetical protein